MGVVDVAPFAHHVNRQPSEVAGRSDRHPIERRDDRSAGGRADVIPLMDVLGHVGQVHHDPEIVRDLRVARDGTVAEGAVRIDPVGDLREPVLDRRASGPDLREHVALVLLERHDPAVVAPTNVAVRRDAFAARCPARSSRTRFRDPDLGPDLMPADVQLVMEHDQLTTQEPPRRQRRIHRRGRSRHPKAHAGERERPRQDEHRPRRPPTPSHPCPLPRSRWGYRLRRVRSLSAGDGSVVRTGQARSAHPPGFREPPPFPALGGYP